MSPSIIQIVIVVVLLILLFGRGKISGLMGDVAQGIKSFKKGIAEDEPAPAKEEPQTIEQKSDSVVTEEKKETSDKAE
ncbi:MAG: twin-arginine translocase TatA/TatE family subunit [Kordiimonadaceae bacterium]|jgi:sec-independent protein translocase protein TatA|nr:twin-arginine translocase TatA/TatE family subunit [Kordiimonadaceae bacterium]MBT6032162.1 twin-arginine translocase TatA/TatE family subunit [Kordiimonadaceae bacterium]